MLRCASIHVSYTLENSTHRRPFPSRRAIMTRLSFINRDAPLIGAAAILTTRSREFPSRFVPSSLLAIVSLAKNHPRHYSRRETPRVASNRARERRRSTRTEVAASGAVVGTQCTADQWPRRTVAVRFVANPSDAKEREKRGRDET